MKKNNCKLFAVVFYVTDRVTDPGYNQIKTRREKPFDICVRNGYIPVLE